MDSETLTEDRLRARLRREGGSARSLFQVIAARSGSLGARRKLTRSRRAAGDGSQVSGLGASLPKLPPQLLEEPHEANTVFTPGDSCETGLEGKRRAAKHGLGGPGIPGAGGLRREGRSTSFAPSPGNASSWGSICPRSNGGVPGWLLNRPRTQAASRGTEAASALQSDSRQEGIGVPGGQTSYRGPCLTPPY